MDLDKMQIGIYEKALPNSMDLRTKLQTAKKAGYKFLEISIDESDERLSRLDWDKAQRKELKNIITETGVTIQTMCLSGHRRFPLGSENYETRQRALDIMKKAIEFSVDIGIRIIQLAGYDVYYEDSNEITQKRFIDGLKQAVSWASKAGVMLAVEIMDTEFLGTIKRAMKYVEEFRSPWFKIYPDLGNLSQWTGDASGELELGAEHTVAIHIKDTKPGVFKCVPFGEGTVDFVKLFSKLSSLRYKGPFLIEMWADNDKKYEDEEAVREILDARLWVEEKMREGELKVC